MADINTLEKSVLESQAKFAAWEQKWREDKLLPLLKKTAKVKFSALTPEQKELIKQTDPKNYKIISELLE